MGCSGEIFGRQAAGKGVQSPLIASRDFFKQVRLYRFAGHGWRHPRLFSIWFDRFYQDPGSYRELRALVRIDINLMIFCLRYQCYIATAAAIQSPSVRYFPTSFHLANFNINAVSLSGSRLRFPGDLSIVGDDDSCLATNTNPAPTGLH